MTRTDIAAWRVALKENALALGTKLIPIARWILGLSALFNLVTALRAWWIEFHSAALAAAIWTVAFAASWLFFERKKTLALGFGSLAYFIEIMLGVNIKNPSKAENVVTATCLVIFAIFYSAMLAERDILSRQKGG